MGNETKLDREPVFFDLNKQTEAASLNFHPFEFACKCKQRNKHYHLYYQELIDKLQWMRDQVKQPININSGYRCEKHNRSRQVKGGKSSQHLFGKAADIWSENITPFHLAFLAGHAGFNGIIIYNNFVHVDIRDDFYFEDKRGK